MKEFETNQHTKSLDWPEKPAHYSKLAFCRCAQFRLAIESLRFVIYSELAFRKIAWRQEIYPGWTL